MSIIIGGASFHYQQQSVFESISLSISPGKKAAIIGNNGTGKSTLLKLIAGELPLASGVIHCNSTPFYLPQKIVTTATSVGQALGVADKIEALFAICNGSTNDEHYATLADDWTVETRCREALDGWGLAKIDLATPLDALSCGQQTKLLLAKISIENPSIILLDEPTNHLDGNGRQKLYQLISSTKATVIVVGHDIELLNLVSQTYELSAHGLKLYGGNYDFYKMQKQIEDQSINQQISAEKSALQAAQNKAQEVRERQVKRVNRASKERSGVPRIILKGRVDKGENTGSKLVETHTDIISAKQQNLSDLRQKQRQNATLKIDLESPQLHHEKLLFEAQGLNFGYADGQLLWENALNFEIRSGQRLELRADNGVGKTTLLKLLIGELQPSVGEIKKADFSFVYLDQQYSVMDTSQTVIELAQSYNCNNLLEHDIKLRLHRSLFDKDMWDRPCNVLSGGQRMRLYLCCLTISNKIADLFILDEPTNNLDLMSLEILTQTIKNYRGTLLVVCHDKRFLEQIKITQTIDLCSPKK